MGPSVTALSKAASSAEDEVVEVPSRVAERESRCRAAKGSLTGKSRP